MIFLNPPYHTYKDIVLLPDHENDTRERKQYYYMPVSPHVSFVDQDPRFQFWRFRSLDSTGPAGGLLNFEVDLGIDEETKEAIKRELASVLKIAGNKIDLAPVQCADGSTKLSILGKQSVSSSTTDKFDGMVKAIASSKPSLYGDNKASFSAQVDKSGATFIDQTLDDYITPLSVIYELSFDALKPAYQVKVSADWEVVKTELRKARGSKSWVAVEISDTVKDMIKKGVIKVNSDTFVTETAAPGIADRRLNFVTTMTEFITDKFFVAEMQPVDVKKVEDKKSEEGLLGIVKSLKDLFTPSALFFLDDIKLKTTNTSTFEAQITERITVRQSINPCSYLSGLYQDMKRRGVSAEELKRRRYIKDISLDDDFFRNREIKIVTNTGGVAFKDLGISTITVRATYNGFPQHITLAKQEEFKDLKWNSEIGGDKRMKWPVDIECTVNFLGTDEFAGQRPVAITRKLLCDTDQCVITPNGDIFVLGTILVDAASLPWARYSAVVVEIRHSDVNSKIEVKKTLTLLESKKTNSCKMFWIVNEKGESNQDYEYRLSYTAKPGQGAADKQTGWQKTTEHTLYLSDPWPNKVSLCVNADADLVAWAEITFINVTFRYIDAEHNINETKTFRLKSPSDLKAEFTVPVVNSLKRTIEYDVEVLKKDKKTKESIKGCFTDENTVDLVYPNLLGKAYVKIGMEPGSWDAAYGKIEIQLRCEKDGDIAKVVFDKTNYREEQRWDYDFPAKNAKPGYEYRVIYYGQGGGTIAFIPGPDKYQTSEARTLTIPRKHKAR